MIRCVSCKKDKMANQFPPSDKSNSRGSRCHECRKTKMRERRAAEAKHKKKRTAFFTGGAFGVFLLAMIGSHVAFAHDDAEWIRQDKRQLGHGWCCGPKDCHVLEPTAKVEAVEGGYIVDGKFMSSKKGPERRVWPSEDYQIWVCRLPDGSARCFFPAESF